MEGISLFYLFYFSLFLLVLCNELACQTNCQSWEKKEIQTFVKVVKADIV